MAVSGVGSVGGELGWASARMDGGAREGDRVDVSTSRVRDAGVEERLSMRAVAESDSSSKPVSVDNANHLAEATAQRVLEGGQGAVQAAAASIDVTGLDTSV